jgi:hypothetical protein
MLRSRAVSLVGAVLALVSRVAAAADEKPRPIQALPIDLVNVTSKTP